MKKFFLLILFSLFITTAYAADGDLDATFDGDGKVSTDVGANYDSAHNAVQQPDGKIVTVGITRNTDTSPDNLLLARYNTNGLLDQTFGTGGTVIVVNGSSTSTNFGISTGIALQADGRILVSLSGSRIFRFNQDGSRDTTFGTNGALTISGNGSISLIGYGDVKVLPGGNILVCGTASNGTAVQGFGLARLNQDGSLDTSFGTGGIVRTAFTTGTAGANASEMDVAANGKIALGGSVNPQTTPGQPGIAVYNADGSPDATFGTGGKVLVAGTSVNFFGSIAWQADGKIVICGRRLRDDGSTPGYIQRYTASGAADTTFGTNGEVVVSVNNQPTITMNDVAIQPDGKILGFGGVFVQFQGNLTIGLAVARYLPNGTPDATFGTNGGVATLFNTSFSGNQSQALTGFLQSDGKIVAAGLETVINAVAGTVNINIAIARYSNAPGNVPVNNPALRVADFDGDGKTDASVFRNGTWFINRSSGASAFGDAPAASDYAVQFGLTTDKLTPADFDGDGKTDIAVWREDSFSYFYILNSSNNTFRFEQFGTTGDSPIVVGDFDGDGKADPAVYRSGTSGGQSFFFYRPSSQPNVNFQTIYWGTGGDQAVRGDFDGDRRIDAAVFRPSDGIWYIRQSSDNQPVYKQFGAATDRRVSGDFDGDGKTDAAIYRNGLWAVLQSSDNAQVYRQFGAATDKVAAGDYDGDGRTDYAVFRDGIFYISTATNQTSVQQFGATADIAVASAFVQ